MSKAIYWTFAITMIFALLLGIILADERSSVMFFFRPDAVASMSANDNALTLAMKQEETRQMQLQLQDKESQRLTFSRNLLIIAIFIIATAVILFAIASVARFGSRTRVEQHFHYFPGMPGFEQELLQDGGRIRSDGTPVDRNGKPVKMITVNQ